MPGEHATQQAVWIAWPVRLDNWRNNAQPAQQAFAYFIGKLADVVAVKVAILPTEVENAKTQLDQSALTQGRIELIPMAYNDAWLRDTAPTMVTNQAGERRAVNWQFNAWGGELDGLYDDWSDDEQVATRIAEFHGFKQYDAPFILEGGSIHCDGEGTVYTTGECLLHPSRNPHLNQAKIEAYLQQYLGIQQVIWLPDGLYNDETNGHIDNLLHIARPGEVLLTVCEDPNDPQYSISQTALKILRTTKDAQGRVLKVHELPMPGPLYLTEEEANGVQIASHTQLKQQDSVGMVRRAGERLAASYANFLICNGVIFYPLLDTKTDEAAASVLAQAFPGYRLEGIPAREILLGGGNLHCITQQVPA